MAWVWLCVWSWVWLWVWLDRRCERLPKTDRPGGFPIFCMCLWPYTLASRKTFRATWPLTHLQTHTLKNQLPILHAFYKINLTKRICESINLQSTRVQQRRVPTYRLRFRQPSSFTQKTQLISRGKYRTRVGKNRVRGLTSVNHVSLPL